MHVLNCKLKTSFKWSVSLLAAQRRDFAPCFAKSETLNDAEKKNLLKVKRRHVGVYNARIGNDYKNNLSFTYRSGGF